VFEVHTEVKRKTAVYGVAAVLLALLLGVSFYNFTVVDESPSPTPTPPKPPSPGPSPPPEQPPSSELTTLQTFSSYEELVGFLRAPYAYINYSLALDRVETFAYAAEGGADFSETNIQVAGVDEADIVKTDGTYLYVVSNNSLFVLKAFPPEEAEVLSRISFNGTLLEIFLNGSKLVLLGRSDSYQYDLEPYYRMPPIPSIYGKTLVEVYDVSNRSNPVLARDFSVSGNYFDSRRIDEYVYLIVTQSAYVLNDTLVPLPKIYSGYEVEEIGASQVYYANVSDYSYAFTTVVAINVQNDTMEPTHETFLLGATSCMYVSPDNIYITFSRGASFWTWAQGGGTLIYRIHIEDEMIKCEAKGEVPGSVLNQFSMDEYNGYFRIATTTGHIARSLEEATSQNHVYVLDMNLTIVGRLEDLAPGEKTYSARFMGNRCYLVTFKKVDPLFVIDLEDPSSPEILGWLKITGYSDYIHPYDENHIIGIGKETVEAEEGDFAWYQGVKISLFDVSNVSNPVEINKTVIGDRGTDSPVLSDHKALLFDKSKNLLVIPVLVAEIDPEKYPEGAPPYTHGDYVWQGAYVFNITLDEGLVLKGRITHLESATDPWAINYWVKRSLYIDNVLYTISDKKVMMHNLETLDEINQIEL
jgi:inhibitor of cysteine peptidase